MTYSTRETGVRGVTLIGLPGSGKSTVGVQLAKLLVRPFIDTDIELQNWIGDSLQSYLDEHGVQALRRAEAACIQQLSIQGHVVATGGSAIYDDAAMKHLSRSSTIAFLEIDYPTMLDRLGDFSHRGIAADLDEGLRPVFDERQALYAHYAQMSVDGSGQVAEVVDRLLGQLVVNKD